MYKTILKESYYSAFSFPSPLLREQMPPLLLTEPVLKGVGEQKPPLALTDFYQKGTGSR
jgi:hypothetical protein